MNRRRRGWRANSTIRFVAGEPCACRRTLPARAYDRLKLPREPDGKVNIAATTRSLPGPFKDGYESSRSNGFGCIVCGAKIACRRQQAPSRIASRSATQGSVRVRKPMTSLSLAIRFAPTC